MNKSKILIACFNLFLYTNCIAEFNNMEEKLFIGFLNLDKPQGPTSHDVCMIVKRILNVNKTSHSGTLDPMVSGVLVMGIGKAARLLRFLPSGKEYVGVMDIHEDIDQKKIEKTIKEHFLGKIKQTPPVKSRVKREEREREIYSFNILEKRGRKVLFKVHCQAGTYIRKLCSDLGEKLGIGAHMLELRRTKAGIFEEKDSLTLYQVQDLIEKYKKGDNEILKHIIPMEIVANHLPNIHVKKENTARILNGSPIFEEFIEKKDKLEKGIFAAIISEKKLLEIAKVVLEGKVIAVPETVLN